MNVNRHEPHMDQQNVVVSHRQRKTPKQITNKVSGLAFVLKNPITH